MQVLLDAGASVTACSRHHGTALNIAATHGELAAVKALLAHSSSAQLPVTDLVKTAVVALNSRAELRGVPADSVPTVKKAVFNALMSAAKKRDSTAVCQYIHDNMDGDAAAMCEFMMNGWEAEAERCAHFDQEKAALQHLIVGAAGLMSELYQVGSFAEADTAAEQELESPATTGSSAGGARGKAGGGRAQQASSNQRTQVGGAQASSDAPLWHFAAGSSPLARRAAVKRPRPE